MSAPLTTTRTNRSGRRLDGGWVELIEGPGQPLDEPPGLAGDEPVAVIAHLSDLHLCDAESPARQEYLDRHGYLGEPYADRLGDIGTYRPQEILTVPVALAMLDAVHRARAPLSGLPAEAAVLTGDLADNGQSNELDWVARLIGGGAVRAASGRDDRSSWVGAPDAHWSPYYYHPESHRSGGVDRWVGDHGFPLVDGLLGAARAELWSPGLGIPAFTVHGNHDLLLQGTVVATDDTRLLAVGDRRAIGLNPGQTPLAVLDAVPGIGPARYLHDATTPVEPVPPDPARTLVGSDAFSRLFPPTAGRGPALAYSAPLNARVRLISIDTVNPNGGWDGSVGVAQLDWLRAELDRASEPYLVVASHHPSWRLVNTYAPGAAEPRVGADQVLATVLGAPRVILWLSGHVHRHDIVVHVAADGRPVPEITSASLIDWPQQSRIVEIVPTQAGGLAVATVAVDHSGPTHLSRPDLSRADHLASISRELARNIPERRRGLDALERRAATDKTALAALAGRNTILTVPDPAR